MTDSGYIRTNVYDCGNNRHRQVSMHRLGMGFPNNKIVDHINHVTYDNRKNNLRIVTHSQNIMNRRLAKNNTSGVVGVYFDNNSKKWSAQIKINGENKYLGEFQNFDSAVNARKDAEKELFGEFSFDASISSSCFVNK